MTIVELSMTASLLGGSIGGGLAGARSGLLAFVVGTVGGAVIGFLGTFLVMVAMSLMLFTFAPREEHDRRLPGRLDDIVFWLSLGPLITAPVWTGVLAFQIVARISAG